MPTMMAPLPVNGMPPEAASASSATFLDVIMDNICGAAESNDDGQAAARDGPGGSLAPPPGETAAGGHSDRERRRPPPQRPPLNNQRRPSQPSQRSSQVDDSYESSNSNSSRLSLPETIILPHLRFPPLPMPSSAPHASPCSSLKDFFDLFLADEAPHSFQLFYESNGDEHVRTTPWKTTVTSGENHLDENTSPTNKCDRREQGSGRMERTITFQTNITPGSSSNPLSQSSDHTSSNNSTVIPLRVTIVQSLSRFSEKWILECEFSFDLHSTKSSQDNSIGVGKKLGTGLGQLLMSNFVKGSTVNVSVTMRGCDDIEPHGEVSGPPRMPSENRGAVRCIDNGHCCNDNVPGLSRQCAPKCNHEGLLSCLSHPLLLPPGLCSGSSTKAAAATAYRRGSPTINGGLLIKSNSDKGATKRAAAEKEGLRNSDSRRNSQPLPPPRVPAKEVGSSFLSTIQTKNAPEEARQEQEAGAEIPISSSWLETVTNWSSTSSREAQWSNPEKQGHTDRDMLSDNSSGGSLKMNTIPSFGMERAPSLSSETEMHRVLLEKGAAAGIAAAPITPAGSRFSPASPSTSTSLLATPSTPGSLLTSPSCHSRAAAPLSRGLSLRIEMELHPSRSNSNNASSSDNLNSRTPSAASSLSSSFGRSASITSVVISSASGMNVDEKVRRGLKKRVARSWTAWAESWCARLWEEERAEVLGGGPRTRRGAADGTRRARRRTHVRPRKGEGEDKPKWKRLQVASSDCVDKSLWMSLDREDECGVEVACTLSASMESPIKRSSSTSALNAFQPPAKREGKKLSSKRRHLSLLKRG